MRHQDLWLAFTVLMGFVGAFLLLETFDAARSVGANISAGAPLPSWPVTATSVVWLFLTILLVADSLGGNGDLDNDNQYLTIRPVADVAGGLMLAAAAKFSVYTIGLGAAVGAGLVAGTGSLRPLLGIAAVAAAIPVTATAVGYPIGFALKGVARRSRNLQRLTTVLGVGVGSAYVVLSVTGKLLTIVRLLEPVLQSPPLAWFARLAFVTTPGAGVDAAGAVALLALAPVVTVAGTAFAAPAARYAWLADGPAPGADDEESGLPTAPNSRLDAALAAVCRAPATRGIASTTLHRAVRSPFQFVFVAPPLLAAIAFVETAVTTGSVPWYVPWFVVWYGAWASGAVLPLNPLGNQGAVLSTLLTSPARGRHVVRGNVVAASLAGVPLTAGIAVAAGQVAGAPLRELLGLSVAGGAAVVGSAIVATGIGSAFPRFDAVSLDAARRAVPPSKRAYSIFSTYLSVTVLAVAVVADETARAVAALVLSQRLPFGLDVGVDALRTIGWVAIGLSVLSIPAAYRLAVRRIETYRVA
ncbi:hypothetical protein GCM10009020_23900 [Natronoarchaeum mannanilyticum]|uniref:ABC transporter permease n=1 Tax=Natronoarchaeum mannanilyticum TaxID=926360 RepID=A0AAV3TAD5_9EURY